MNEKYLFFDARYTCHETMYTHVKDILNGRRMDQNVSE